VTNFLAPRESSVLSNFSGIFFPEEFQKPIYGERRTNRRGIFLERDFFNVPLAPTLYSLALKGILWLSRCFGGITFWRKISEANLREKAN
jgi:hypothetical protein